MWAVAPPLLRWHWLPALHPRWQIRHRGKRQADGSKCSFESEPCLTLLPGVIQRKTFRCCCLFCRMRFVTALSAAFATHACMPGGCLRRRRGSEGKCIMHHQHQASPFVRLLQQKTDCEIGSSQKSLRSTETDRTSVAGLQDR